MMRTMPEQEPEAPRQLSRVDWLLFVAIVVLAMTVRVMFLLHAPDRQWPYSAYYQGDAVEWVAYATALDQGQPFEFDLPLRSPAVAYLLHGIHPGVIHGPFVRDKLLWCGISALTCGLAYLAFIRAGRRIALVASAMCVFSFGSYITATSLNNECLYTFLLMLLVLVWQQLMRGPSIVLAIVAGALHGMATLVRQEHTLFMIIMLSVAAWEFWILDFGFWIGTNARGSQSKIQNPKSKIALPIVVLLTSIIVCLPWSIHGYRAIQRFNTVTRDNPDYDHFRAQWTPEARARIDSLPAFARQGNAAFIDAFVVSRGMRIVTPREIDRFFNELFGGYVPKPISPWVLVSMRGPLEFALANHRDAHGGFSKAALIRFDEQDPSLVLGRPDHLRLVNEGYSIGLRSIGGDFHQWLINVGAKLSNFADGIALGFTSANAPLGRAGVRRPVDVISPEPGHAIPWRLFMLALAALGMTVAILRRMGLIWLAVIGYKVIVTILFYGYARQAVSILPAFYFFQAVALVQIGEWLHMRKLQPNIVKCAAIGLVSLLFIVDLYASWRQPAMIVDGPQRLAPQWGADAFESVETIHLRPISS